MTTYETLKKDLCQNIMEYATLRGDLVIYRCTGMQHVRGCLVHFDGPEAEHIEYLSGMVTKLKVDNTSSSPVWEYFYNMSAVEAILRTRLLREGKVVDKVYMYGVVAVLNRKLLYLEIDKLATWSPAINKFHRLNSSILLIKSLGLNKRGIGCGIKVYPLNNLIGVNFHCP